MDDIKKLETMLIRASEAGDEEAVQHFTERMKKASANAFDLDNDVSNNMSGMDFLGGAKHAFDKAAYGLANTVESWLGSDFTDAIGPTREERDKQLQQGQDFVDQASRYADVGELTGDIGIAAVPGGAVYKGAKALTGATKLPKMLEASTRVGVNAGGNAGIAYGLTPEDKAQSAALAGGLGAAGDVGIGAYKFLSQGLPGSMLKVKPHAQQLMDEGVTVPVTKSVENPMLRRVGELGRSWPIAGPPLKKVEDEALRTYTENFARSAMPEKIPTTKNGKTEWEDNPTMIDENGNFLNQLKDQFDNFYQSLYRDNNVKIPMAKNGVYDLRQQADEILEDPLRYQAPAAEQAQKTISAAMDDLDGFAYGRKKARESILIDPETSRPFVKEAGNLGSIPADNFNETIAKLDKAATGMFKDGNNAAANMVAEFAEKLREARIAGAPKEIQELINPINKKYAKFKLLLKAMQGKGANARNVVTPNELQTALKALTKNKDTFALNRTHMGDRLVKDIDILGDIYPSTGPGTAEKLGAMEAYTNPSVRRTVLEMIAGNINDLAVGNTQTQKFLSQPLVSQSQKAKALRAAAAGVPAGSVMYSQEQ